MLVSKLLTMAGFKQDPAMQDGAPVPGLRGQFREPEIEIKLTQLPEEAGRIVARKIARG